MLPLCVLQYLTSASSIFLQQSISDFNLHGVFHKPLRNTCDVSGQIDGIE